MKRIGVLFPFLLYCLCGLIVGCNSQEESTAGNPPTSDSLWTAYITRHASDTLSIDTKLDANREMLRHLSDPPDSTTSLLLQHRAALFRQQREWDSALRYLNRNLEVTRALGDSSRVADAHFRLGFYYRMAGANSRSLYHYYQAKELFKALNDSVQVGRKSLNLANLLNALGNYSEAEAAAVEGLEYIEPGNLDTNTFIAGLYNALAVASKELRNYPEALAWYQKSLDLKPDRQAEINIRHNVAVVLTHMDSLQRAYSISMELARDSLLFEPGKERLRARVIDHLGYVQGKLNRNDALENLREALRLRQEIGYAEGQFSSYLHLAEYYQDKDPARAQAMAVEAHNLAQSLENPEDRLTSLELLIDIMPNPGAYARSYTRLNDSIQQVRRQTKDDFAKVRYESEKNLQNYLIARQEASEKSLDLERSQNRNLLLLSFVGVLLICAFFIYRYLKLHHKKREIQAVYATETRISKKVHDELANDIFNLLNSASAFPESNQEELRGFIDRLDRVYKKSREISRDSAEVPTGPKFKTVLSSLIDLYSSDSVRIITKGFDSISWESIEPEKQINIYRALQEILVNMKKHSKASLVLLAFNQDKKSLEIRYKDNGVGFPEGKPVTHGGLGNTENRIDALGGRVIFGSSEQQGIAIQLIIPV